MYTLSTELYKKLFDRALAYTNIYKNNRRDEDMAQDAIIHLIQRLKIDSGTTENQIWAFANIVLKNYCTSQIKKKKEQLQYIDQLQADIEDQNESEVMYHQIKEKLTQQEYDYAIAYFSSKHTKTNQEKVKMARIKEKVLSNVKEEKEYVVLNMVTNKEFKVKSFKQLADHLGVTTELIRIAYQKKTVFAKKMYKFIY